MKQDEHETPVVFRNDAGEVTAVFPCEPADHNGRFMACYAHVGQHGSCCLCWYRGTRAAKPDEYAPLLAELISIGYRPKVYKRIQPKHRVEFDAKMRNEVQP